MNGNIVVSNSLGEAKHIRNMLDKRTNIEHIWDEVIIIRRERVMLFTC